MVPYSSSGVIQVSRTSRVSQLIWKDVVYTLNVRLSSCMLALLATVKISGFKVLSVVLLFGYFKKKSNKTIKI